MSDDIQALADKALETFDLGEYITGTVTLPEDNVTVYLDTKAAYEIERLTLEHERGVLSTDDGPKGITDEATDAELLAKIEALREQIKSTGLTVYMRAMNEPERDLIRSKVKRANPIAKNAPEEERAAIEEKREVEVLEEWLARATTKIVRPDGAVISDVTVGHIQALKTTLWDSEWDKLPILFGTLSFAERLMESAIDAGFPSGETVPA